MVAELASLGNFKRFAGDGKFWETHYCQMSFALSKEIATTLSEYLALGVAEKQAIGK